MRKYQAHCGNMCFRTDISMVLATFRKSPFLACAWCGALVIISQLCFFFYKNQIITTTWQVVNTAVNFCLFSKTRSDSDSLLFAEENPLVGQSHSKRNFAETIFLFEISTFFGSTTPSRAIHYFVDHIQTEMIENLFHEGHEQKTFFA